MTALQYNIAIGYSRPKCTILEGPPKHHLAFRLKFRIFLIRAKCEISKLPYRFLLLLIHIAQKLLRIT